MVTRTLLFVISIALITTAGCNQDSTGPKPAQAEKGSAPSQPGNNAGAGSAPAQAITEKQLMVTRYTSANISDGEVDSILSDASTVLQNLDAPSDVSCPLRLKREGPVGTFATGTGIVDSESSFNAVCSAPGYVHVVTQIDWCGAFIPDVIGCASTPGNCMVVVRHTNSPSVTEGILWAHEYGHTKGLDHRDVPDAVMRSFIEPTHRLLTSPESMAYLQSMQPAFVSAAAPPSGDVKKFVRQDYIHGIPRGAALSYKSDANVDILAGMLSDSSESQHWAKIAVTLGIMGNERALEPLISFIIRGKGTLAPNEFRAKSAAVMAIGFLTKNLQGNTRIRALTFLTRGAVPSQWQQQGLQWTSPAAGALNRNGVLARKAIQGLGLSGSSEAIAYLTGLQRTGSVSAATATQLPTDLIEEAVRANRTIIQNGYETLFRRQR